MEIIMLIVIVLALCMGIMIGHCWCVRSLTDYPYSPVMTGPHRLRGRYYYLIHASVWTSEFCTCVKDELDRERR